MTEVRMLAICYRLLARMDRRTQLASIAWLIDRLREDHDKGKRAHRATSKHDRIVVRDAVGDAALSLLSLLQATGGSAGRRSVEIRGPINTDVVVYVRPVREASHG